MLGYFFSKFNEAAQGPSANLSGKKSEKNKGFFLFILPQCAAVERAGLQKLKRESEGAAVFYFYN